MSAAPPIAAVLLMDGCCNIAQDRHSAETRNDLAQQLESLAGKIGGLEGKAGDVAARPRQALHQAAANRVACQRKDDRDDRYRLL